MPEGIPQAGGPVPSVTTQLPRCGPPSQKASPTPHASILFSSPPPIHLNRAAASLPGPPSKNNWAHTTGAATGFLSLFPRKISPHQPPLSETTQTMKCPPSIQSNAVHVVDDRSFRDIPRGALINFFSPKEWSFAGWNFLFR